MIRLSIPSLDRQEKKAVCEVLASGYLVQGRKVAQFEEVMADYLGVKHAIAVSSGTAALHLALLAAGVKSGDEVIVPDFTFPATANVVELCGSKPVIVDINPDTYNIDPDSIGSAITSKTKVIMPVHLFGQSADMHPIMRLAKRRKLLVIEDAACSLGAKYKDSMSGTIGDMGCFSFHPRKVITTGEGGLIITDSNTLAGKLRSMRNHGIEYIEDRLNFVMPGFNYRMTELQAAIGIVQMLKLDDLLRKRQTIAVEYAKQLKTVSWITPPVSGDGNTHVFQTYAVKVAPEIDRDLLIKHLRSNGVEVNFGTYALHRLTFYKNQYKLKPAHFPVTEKVFLSTIALPFFDTLKKDQIKFIVNVLKKFK